MNKAREFEDFVLDDYDFNALEDWDLEYLWDWVEFDDFSDFETEFQGGADFDPDGAYEFDSDDEHDQDNHQSDDDEDDDDLEEDDDEYPYFQFDDDDDDLFDFDENYGDDDDDDFEFDEEDDDTQESYDFNFDDDEENNGNDDASGQQQDKDYHYDIADKNNNLKENVSEDTQGHQTQHSNSSYSQPDQKKTETKHVYDDDELEFLRSIGLAGDEDEQENSETDNFDGDSGGEHGDGDENTLMGKPRYIETSAGTIDLELDDILGKLQLVEFDEFIDILQRNNHVYDKIIEQREWSDEEMEFLKSIEPIIRDKERLEEIRNETASETSSKKTNKENLVKNSINTQTFASLEDMFLAMREKAIKLSRENRHKARYMPKNLIKLWNIDTEDKQANRIGHIFGQQIASKPNPYGGASSSLLGTSKNNMSSVIGGKNQGMFQELKQILTNETKMMANNLDKQSLEYIRQDGQRFGQQFINFLVQKYGSKMYFLFYSQLKYEQSSDKLSLEISNIFAETINPHCIDDYCVDFFEAVFIILEENGMEI